MDHRKKCKNCGARLMSGNRPVRVRPAPESTIVTMPASGAEFLAKFFARTQHTVELRALPSKARCFTRKQSAVKRFVREHARENIYFGAVTREAGGQKSNCRELTAFWANIDFKTISESQARDQLKLFQLQPSIVIESGGGLHVYWLLDVAIEAQGERVESILRGLTAALGADPAVAEVARIMRLPGTYNQKYEPRRECRVLEAHWDRRYALSSFEPFVKAEREAKSGNSTERIADGRRNSTLTSVAGTLRRIGLAGPEIREVLLVLNSRRCVPPLPESEVDGIARSIARYSANESLASSGSVWAADNMETFLSDDTDEIEPLFDKVLYRESITNIFSPRGIGKSLFALFLAVWLALKGYRVLLLDRDNPRRVVRERLRAWGAGADLSTLRVITREKCPPLTNAAAWAEFPYLDYDVVILDSLDSMAEGVGEQDSGKPSRAIAAVLDIARRDGGPGVLILGNCVRTGKHSRGSGVIEDRADIVYEVRDATNFHPSGNKVWFEELPPSDAGSWAGRSARRRQIEIFRLAFIPTKFRIAEQPEPFAMEIDTTTHPWTMADVTDSIDQEGAVERERQAQERASAVQAAAELLKAEILQGEARGEPVLLKKQAEALLTSLGIKQKIAREAINSSAFEILDVVGKGHPKGVRLAGKNNGANRNTTRTESAIHAGSGSADFGHPHPARATEIDPETPQCLSGFQRHTISAKDTLSIPTEPFSTEPQDKPIPPHSRGTQGTEEEL